MLRDTDDTRILAFNKNYSTMGICTGEVNTHNRMDGGK